MKPLSIVARIAALAFTASLIAVPAVTISEALFLNAVGATWLPAFFVGFASLSVPLALALSMALDRFPRQRVYLTTMAALAAVFLLLAGLSAGQPKAIVLLLYAAVLFGEIIVVDVFFWTVVADYLTSLEQSRRMALLTVCSALGGLVGGGLAAALVTVFAPSAVLFFLPALVLVVLWQILNIEQSGAKLEDEDDGETDDGVWEAIRTFPGVIRRYAIIGYLALGTLLAVMLTGLSQYLYLSIYATEFTETAALAGFLAKVSIAFNAARLLVILTLTGALLRWCHVVLRNMFFPLSLLASFWLLATQFRISSAIFAHFTADALASSVYEPVTNLNFTAVPHRYFSKVRVLNDLLIYPLGLALSGLFLMAAQGRLSDQSLAWLGAGGGGVFLVVGLLLGRAYVPSLLESLRSGEVEMAEASRGLARLPQVYARDIGALLASKVEDEQRLGLQLAERLDDFSLVVAEVEAMLPTAPPEIRRLATLLLLRRSDDQFAARIAELLTHSDEVVREAALLTLLRLHSPIDPTQIAELLHDPDARLRTLARLVALTHSACSEPHRVALIREINGDPSGGLRRLLIQAIAERGDIAVLRRLFGLLDWQAVPARAADLDALVPLVEHLQGELIQLALDHLHHPDTAVAAAAFRLLASARDPGLVGLIASGLDDECESVRLAAAESLARLGHDGLEVARRRLHASRPEVIEAAVLAVGRVGSADAREELVRFLQRDFDQILWNIRAILTIPAQDPRWQSLAMAITDVNAGIVDRTLQVLSALGHDRTLSRVRRVLHSPSRRQRANAIQMLVSLDKHRIVGPILPLLELRHQPTPPPLPSAARVPLARPADAGPEYALPSSDHPPQGMPTLPTPVERSLLREASQSTYRWVRAAAAETYNQLQLPLADSLRHDPESLVRQAADAGQQKERLMNRLVFLKKVTLFESLQLDDLLMIDRLLHRRTFVAGERLIEQGTPGTKLYLLASGQVRVTAGSGRNEQLLVRLQAPSYFGEMALLDDAPRTASVIADEEGYVFTLGRKDFRSLISQRPEILLQMCRVLSQRLRDTNNRLASMMESRRAA